MNKTLYKYFTILVLSLAGGSIYTLPYLKYVFYDTQIEVMNINNMQSGFLITMYALGGMLTYIPGGILTDRISPRKAISYSLFGTAILGLIYAYTMSYSMALVLWFLFAITTAFVFWTSLLKAISIIGDSSENARLYGIYYAGNGLAGAAINGLALKAASFGLDPKQSLFYAVIVMAGCILLSGVLVFVVLKDKSDKSDETSSDDKINFSHVKELLKDPMLWCLSIIVFTGYSIFSSTTYFNPYLTNVVGISVHDSGMFSIIRSYLFYLIAPFGGYLADKVFKSTSKLFVVLFALLAGTFIGVMFLPSTMSATSISIYTLLPGAFGLMLYGLVFSIVRETGIPMKVAGTAIGIASIIGYTPDLFLSTMFGHWLDTYSNSGYSMIFSFLGGMSLLGLILATVLVKKNQLNERKPVTA
ncbi:MFS transporter [Celerinatantimonas diazotrophica]|uniref:Sugar phosphate permease n=1 Tax=Celerinatantimonas diazotrophica TaxID=412034 RepID=A0A4R1JA90_9GAMM|nr:MFS transporter [Celerinatantimonas diazotrophica]TCK47556.1 sugar phosphate permease [Celerinatantimonas diazotrophica]CAG9296824.1 Inner membrane protein YihN [Celerinatantimonas diazotrophica]